MKHTIAVLVQIETNDPRLDPDTINVSTARATAALRAAVLANLKRITRVIAVMPIEQARAITLLHEGLGELLLNEMLADRPPPDYIPPTRD